MPDEVTKTYEEISAAVQMVTEMEIRYLVKDWTVGRFRAKIELAMTEGGGLHPSTLSRWHSQRSAPREIFAGSLLEVLDAKSLDELGLGYTDEAARNFTFMSESERKREVHRRKWLKALGAAGAAGAAELLLPVSPLVATAQRLAGRRGIGADEVDSARDTATMLAIAYSMNPGPDSARAAQGHAYTLLNLLKTNSAEAMGLDARADLKAVASDAAALAGYTQVDVGRFENADRWFASALELAREAGDRRLEALALAASGHTTPMWVLDRANAIAARTSAAEMGGFLPPAGRAWLFSYLAKEHAMVGDDLVSGRFLEQARTAATRIRQRDPGWGWWSTHAGELAGFDGARTDTFAGIRLRELGHPEDALKLADASLTASAQPVRRVSLLVDVMKVCVPLDDPDRACASGIAVLDTAEARGYGLGDVGNVREVHRSFPRSWSPLMVVRELGERLRAAA